MGIRDQTKRALYGSQIGSSLLVGLPIPSASSFLNTATAGVATGNYATAVGVLVGNNYDLANRSTKPYILEKHYLSGRYWTGLWYFGRCVDATGAIIAGTDTLKPYPFRGYLDDNTGYYGTLPLGVQGVQGRIVVTGARFDFRKNSATAGSNGPGVATLMSRATPSAAYVGVAAGIAVDNTNSAETTGFAAAAAGLCFSLSSGVIATNAVQTAVEAASAGTGAGSVTDGALSNLIAFKTTGTLSSGAQNFAGANYINTLITDSSGGTASTTFAAITATVTSTVVANAIAQLAANENKRLGLFGTVLGTSATAGTSAVQGLFLNLGSTTTADGDNGTDNVIEGELLLNGVVEVQGLIVGDI